MSRVDPIGIAPQMQLGFASELAAPSAIPRLCVPERQNLSHRMCRYIGNAGVAAEVNTIRFG